MSKPDPAPWLGKQSVVVVFQVPGEEPVWHQGRFGAGTAAGLSTRYAYANMEQSGRIFWAPIPDDAEIVCLLPHPAKGTTVQIDTGDFAGKHGVVVDTIPNAALVDVKVAGQVIRVSATEITSIQRLG